MHNPNQTKLKNNNTAKSIWITPEIFVANLDKTRNNSLPTSIDHNTSFGTPIGDHS